MIQTITAIAAKLAATMLAEDLCFVFLTADTIFAAIRAFETFCHTLRICRSAIPLFQCFLILTEVIILLASKMDCSKFRVNIFIIIIHAKRAETVSWAANCRHRSL